MKAENLRQVKENGRRGTRRKSGFDRTAPVTFGHAPST